MVLVFDLYYCIPKAFNVCFLGSHDVSHRKPLRFCGAKIAFFLQPDVETAITSKRSEEKILKTYGTTELQIFVLSGIRINEIFQLPL